MLKEDIENRKVLRAKILSSLYDHHFNNNGAPYQTTKEELKDVKEEALAYKYLVEKGYVHEERQGMQYLLYSITAHGIDHFESNFISE